MNAVESEDMLGTLLGRIVSRSAGPRMVSLPFGLEVEVAVSIVRSANALRPDIQPAFAILMAGTEMSWSDVTIVGAHQAAQYREGDRLLVVHGSHTDLASNTQTFIEILGPSWPEIPSEVANLEVVAHEALSLLLGVGNASEAAESRLLSVLRTLLAAYRRLGSGLESWNTLWWRHVSEGLRTLRTVLSQAPPSAERESFLQSAIPASFGLPQLPGSVLEEALASKLARAWPESWGDSEAAKASATAIGLRVQDRSGHMHPIATVDFQKLDEYVVLTGNPLSAWGRLLCGDPASVEAVRALTLDDFLTPFGNEDQSIMVLANSQPCAYEPLTGDLAFVGTESVISEVQSEILELRLPVVAQIPVNCAPTRLAITTSLKAFRFDGDVSIEGGRPIARGRITCQIRRFKVRTLTLGIAIPAGDPLEGVVPSTAMARVALMHPDLPTVCARSLQKDVLGTRTQMVVLDQANGDISETLPGSGGHRLIISEPSGLLNPIVQGQESDVWPSRPHFRYAKTLPGDVLVEIGDSSVELTLPDNPKKKRLSPLLAHIDGVPVQDGPAPDAVATEVRGVLEQKLFEMLALEDEPWRAGLGHFVLPVDEAGDVDGFLLDPHQTFMTCREWAQPERWKALQLPRVPQELMTAAEAAEFRSAFLDLGLFGELREYHESGRNWPSRLDFAGLWRTSKLERYLSSYVELVNRAKRIGDDIGVFWATYPFSCSAWSVEGISQLEAILLSPLHPIRLAWLAGVSSGVEAEPDQGNRRRFSGVIEGWNFPYLGPSEVAEGKVIAIPIDNGPEQLFIGWSLMARTTNKLAPLRTPERIAGRRAPGSSVSGLNGSSAAKAMSDYRRLNPFTSTLTVDLAAASPGPRMEAVDRAVIDEITRWSQQSEDSLSGGARVWDSMYRVGEPPRDYVSSRIGSSTPLTWSRYEPKPASGPRSNLRILQDAGHTLHITSGKAEPLGSVGFIPFRRHEVLMPKKASSDAIDAVPSIREGAGWEPFAHALRAAEDSAGIAEQRIVRSVLAGSSLGSDRADWTITGDAMVNPSALASQVGSGNSGLGLWEWRPPFLSATSPLDDALLERRPYLSIVRLPSTLTDRVNNLLEQSWGKSWGVTAQDVLAQLGSRGIGLSSLLAIGGAQARGALGFFTALSLLDRAGAPDGEQLVLPIDACDEYLTALSGEKHTLGDRRRADLLLVRLTRDEVVLVPIEIKYYGLDTPSSALPDVGAASLSDPLEQLAASNRVLMGLTRSHQADLWNAAFAAVVELGLRLNPDAIRNRGWAADRLAALADGAVPITVGKPLLAFFKHGSGSYRITQDVAGSDPEMPLHGELVADPARVAQALYATPSHTDDFLREWQQLVDWACGSSREPAAGLETAYAPTAASHRGERVAATEPLGEAATPTLDESVGESRIRQSPRDFTKPATDSLAATNEAAISGDGVRFTVGRLVDSVGEADAYFWPANTALTQLNVGVVGNLGTGKTQLVKAFVAKLRAQASLVQENPISVLILDYKGDFAGEEFLNAVGGRLLRPHRLPVNFFELQEPYSSLAAVRKAGSFNDVLNQIFNIGPKQQNTLRRVIMDLFSSGRTPTIAEVLERYKDAADYDSVVGVLEGWVLAEVFGEGADDLLSFADLMKDSVVVVSLLDFGSDQSSKNALVALFLNMYYEYMAKLPKWPYQGHSPQLRRLNSFLLVDEATNIMSYKFDALNSLLLQGREFGVGVILSSQYLDHFKSSKVDYAQALRTWIIHSVPNVTASQLHSLGLPNATDETAKRIVGLPTHHALYSSLGYPGRFIEGEPFFRWHGGQ